MIKSSIKKIIPKFVIKALRYLKEKLYDNAKKKFIFLKMRKKHKYLLNEIKGKEKVKIIFLVIRRSVWKVDPVFKKMLADPFFEPLILVIPDTTYNEELMWEEMNETFKYFEAKGYPTEFAYKEESNKWTALHEMKPDIIFFTDPHNLTRKEYYEDAYLNYLSCYVPYHHEVGSYGSNIGQYNQKIHNALWYIFSSHKASYELFAKTSAAKASNVIVTGYPAMEELLNKEKENNYRDAWKSSSDGRLRVIWAPHHTISDPNLPYSNFIEYASEFQDLALKYKSKVIWAFKPHPILKSKLYLHSDWGKVKTDLFYSFWAEQPFSQLEEGEYFDLFLSSDIMIHDSGSFLAEYLYLRKPVMYLLSEKNHNSYYSDFGIKALESCEIGKCFDDVKKFIDKSLLGKAKIKLEQQQFISDEIDPYFKNTMPSEVIISTLKRKLHD